MLVSREVTDNEQACRICKDFKAHRTCWTNVKDVGENCKDFDRDYDIKTVIDFKDDV